MDMEKLRSFFNSLNLDQRAALCKACITTEGYLRKAMSVGSVGPKLAVALERATNGVVTREELRPDIFGPLPSTQGDTSPQAQGPERESA